MDPDDGACRDGDANCGAAGRGAGGAGGSDAAPGGGVAAAEDERHAGPRCVARPPAAAAAAQRAGVGASPAPQAPLVPAPRRARRRPRPPVPLVHGRLVAGARRPILVRAACRGVLPHLPAVPAPPPPPARRSTRCRRGTSRSRCAAPCWARAARCCSAPSRCACRSGPVASCPGAPGAGHDGAWAAAGRLERSPVLEAAGASAAGRTWAPTDASRAPHPRARPCARSISAPAGLLSFLLLKAFSKGGQSLGLRRGLFSPINVQASRGGAAGVCSGGSRMGRGKLPPRMRCARAP
jgi:hypothetical protein